MRLLFFAAIFIHAFWFSSVYSLLVIWLQCWLVQNGKTTGK